jgi:misacylated tRNA(Ala) deacylase
MTKALYMDDSYLKEFDAEIMKAEGSKIILDQTAFYPESGGQLHDEGKLIRLEDNREFKVTNVRKESGEIVHYVDCENDLNAKDKVKGIIDWDRRYKLMRMHTAAHVLSAIINFQTQAMITGNQLGLDKSRIDFDLENFDKAQLEEYFRSANEIISWNLPLKVYTVSIDQMANDKKLCKLAKGLPPGLKEIRVVEIESFDKQADGGTHVKSVGEVGKIKLIDTENKGANNRRVYFSLE